MLINVKAIEDSIDRYLLTKGGFPTDINSHGDNYFPLQDLLDIDLSGGEWVDWGGSSYQMAKFVYSANCTKDYCSLNISNPENSYASAILEMYWFTGEKEKTCYTNNLDKGRFICKYLEPLGWEYYDDEY